MDLRLGIEHAIWALPPHFVQKSGTLFIIPNNFISEEENDGEILMQSVLDLKESKFLEKRKKNPKCSSK